MARQQPHLCVSEGEFSPEFDCLGIIGKGGGNGVLIQSQGVMLLMMSDLGNPPGSLSVPANTLKPACVCSGQSLIPNVFDFGTNPKIASSIIQSISANVVNLHVSGRVSYKSMEPSMHIASPCAGSVFDIYKRLRHNTCVPLELVDSLVVFVIDEGDVAFGQRNFFWHGSREKTGALAMRDSEARGASRTPVKLNGDCMATEAYHHFGGSQCRSVERSKYA